MDCGGRCAMPRRVRVNLPIDDGGYTRLMWLCSEWKISTYPIIVMLEAQYADPNQRDCSGMSALMWLAITYRQPEHRAGVLDCLKLLLDNGADPTATCDAGWSALHYACATPSDLELVMALVDAGANVLQRNSDGRRAMELEFEDDHPAAPMRHAAIVAYLRERRAERLRGLLERWRRAAFLVGCIARFVSDLYVEVSFRPGGAGARRAHEEFEGLATTSPEQSAQV